jgi:hypothetical protein
VIVVSTNQPIQRSPIPSPIPTSANSLATPIEKGFTVEAIAPTVALAMIAPRRDHPVVTEREHQGDEQRVEAERLVRPAHRGPQQREERHHRGDHEPRPCAHRVCELADRDVERARGEHHRHERADREHEREHAHGTEEPADPEGHHRPGLGVLEAVEAVDRRQEEIADPVAEVLRGVDLLEGAGRRDAVLVVLVRARRNQECRDPGQRDCV